MVAPKAKSYRRLTSNTIACRGMRVGLVPNSRGSALASSPITRSGSTPPRELIEVNVARLSGFLLRYESPLIVADVVAGTTTRGLFRRRAGSRRNRCSGNQHCLSRFGSLGSTPEEPKLRRSLDASSLRVLRHSATLQPPVIRKPKGQVAFPPRTNRSLEEGGVRCRRSCAF